MELNEKQKEGLSIAVERYCKGEKYTVISGYAGVGKSTLVKFIISALPNVDPEKEVVYTSFTGKAAQVLQKKGNKNVSTLHRLLFKSFPRPDGSFVRLPVETLEPYKIVIVDECSMVPAEILKMLLKYPVHIICLGDPGQLPPINKSEDNHLLDNPHVFLDEVMRQAEESEILKLSMDIRQNKPLTPFKGKDVQVLNKNELTTGMLLWADQIICATNATRISINNKMRELLGKEGDPQDGEKVICLKNNWDIYSNTENPLVNGTVGYLKNAYTSFIRIPGKLTSDRKTKNLPLIIANFVSDTYDDYSTVTMDKGLFSESGESSLDSRTSFMMSRNVNFKDKIPEQFTYGYAITGWKAQGSEWNNVLVIEEGFPYNVEEHKRFLYTCVTRAARRLVIIKKD